MVPEVNLNTTQNNPEFGRGFTLIELMIVVAIIAIILTLALPVYTDYSVRAKIGEALSVGAAAKTAVSSTCVEDPNISPINQNNTGYQFTNPTRYVATIDLGGPCNQPVIRIQTQNTGASPNPLITLTGEIGAGRMQFTCATSGAFYHVPLDCRNAIP